MLKIMIIEDEKDHFELMEHAIKKEFPDAMVELCETADLCLERLEAGGMDIIIADYLLAGMTGLQLLEELKKRKIEVPVIMVTGHGDEGLAVKAMKSGAFDYVVKSGSFFELIPEIVRKAIHDRELKAKMRRTEEEKKRLQAQFLHAQKMEAVGTLAGGIAHDFNNLLQTIKGFTQILLSNCSADDPGHAGLKQIEHAAERAGELTRQLLTFSRKVKIEPRPIDINDHVKAIKELSRTLTGMIEIELLLADDLKTVNADPGQMEQVLMNLTINARDAMPEGGRLIIKTENATLDHEYCRTHLGAVPGEYVLLTVSDTGHGMDKETVERIFEPFYTTKVAGKGAGLGLSTVYGIVKGHDGYIMCCSKPGEGTTFEIYLPALKQEREGRSSP